MTGKFGIPLGENSKGGKELHEIKKMAVLLNFFTLHLANFEGRFDWPVVYM